MTPYTLIAELTYCCPLRCSYCSNPVNGSRAALPTETWLRVLDEAERLGVVQVAFTGGEPLLRQDLEALVERARARDLYSNLITSGVPLSRERLRRLQSLGLDHVQLSFQSLRPERARQIAGGDFQAQKMKVAGWVRELGLPLTLNVVLHRENLDEVDDFIALARRLGADRLELANTQYLGWAFENRERLLPTEAQIARAREAARAEFDVLFVLPDYFSGHPRACMDGWARRYVVVAPDGTVLPCQAAAVTGLPFERVGERSLGEIWHHSPSLERFRGTNWMPEPCRSCDRREVDFGGCRCQAFLLTGDAAATDPACDKSPHHSNLLQIAVR
jgi:pyrroloquinoline quinone biosynthesis protein E